MTRPPYTTLRPLEPEDLELLYQIENDPAQWDICSSNVPYSHFALREYITHCTYDIYKDCQVRWMIDNAEGQTVGIIDLSDFDPRHLKAEMGIFIRSEFRGMGYGQSAVAQLIAYAHGVLHLHQIYSFVTTDNAASLALHEKMGFRRSAVIADWFYNPGGYADAYMMQFFFKKDE